MNIALELKHWTADEFVETDQHEFGPLWRYELVDGQIIGHAAPSPDHAAIVVNLATAVTLALRRRSSPPCRGEAGSAATPKTQQRDTARIPDLTIRCGEHPRVFFDAVSPSELRNVRARDRKRRDLQGVAGVQEIVEVAVHEYACHIYRRSDPLWTFDSLDGSDATIRLESVGIDIPLAELYATVEIPEQDSPQ